MRAKARDHDAVAIAAGASMIPAAMPHAAPAASASSPAPPPVEAHGARPSATLRPATLHDLDALAALECAAFDADRISRRSFRNLLQSRSALVIAAMNDVGGLAGYAAILFRAGTALARLYSIAVAGEAAGRGVGAALLARAEHEAFERDRIGLRLEVREDNSRAIALYRRAGYRPIGRYLDYYADHTSAIRFEKTLRGDHPLDTGVPYYEQTTDFTCGACCLMMALARDGAGVAMSPVLELRLWRQATTIFMMSGPGGCEPYGLAVTAHEMGLDAAIHVSEPGDLFLDGVRSPEKQRVMALAQEDFRARAEEYGIPVTIRPFTIEDLRAAVAAGRTATVLISGYHMFGQKVPHWVLVHGDDGRHLVIHDPWVADERGESMADAANLPIPYAAFARIARFGKVGLKAAVFLERRGARGA
ncbi:GNAT family N-acetyltransferase/peptidase C39 family protein [Aureimonas pseudogalii]|uniref:Ribosomal protein S18 acetylase RimI-like enzyme n=1 Tax=Aureimonas pseudogalii TaxID=1744844 RepID=A0A7W6EAB9_9HYPH|nr:peptidase C39 family protein [Aureimonas pseudogalii]MBB3997657.1 ribosomal protein S18 acetylase RimI-like enzyme [Aureimonas pseudogalii]